ncbi:peptidoglycan-binding protein [Paenibacillus riograndensis]|uniref:peptidoglycan-binding protein n=1 Tax=Paenibacillus riograndensis TaxID=483937 RepID=UPI000764B419|nr:peptidoglycan-binding domain-containing protein [Paenibacillus riograndensis]
MSKGQGNIAAIGTAVLNTKWGTNYKELLRKGDSHAEVAVLKENLRNYRSGSRGDWSKIPEIKDVSPETFDEQTEQNLIQFQGFENLTADGVYGQSSRNRMAARIGVSSKGFIRLESPPGASYINFNDTKEGMKKDQKYLLDHSWLTKEAVHTLGQLADSFRTATGKKLEINDCSLIDGEDTPEHKGHQTGKEVDIRNAGMTAEEEKTLLELCSGNEQIKTVFFHEKYGIVSDKITLDAEHNDHFHVDVL